MNDLRIYPDNWPELLPLLTADAGPIDPASLGDWPENDPIGAYCIAAELVRREREKRKIRLWPMSPTHFNILRRLPEHPEYLYTDRLWRGGEFIGGALAAISCPYHEANVIGLIEGAKQ